MSITLALLTIGRTTGRLSLNPYSLQEGQEFLPASLCFALHSTLSLTALHGMNIPMYGAIKRCTPLVSLLLSVVLLKKPIPSWYVFFVLFLEKLVKVGQVSLSNRLQHFYVKKTSKSGKRSLSHFQTPYDFIFGKPRNRTPPLSFPFSSSILLSILTITVGVFIASAGDLEYDGHAYLMGGLSVFAQGGYLTLVQKASEVHKLSAVEMIHVNAFNTLPFFVVMSLVMSEPAAIFASTVTSG